MEGHRHRRKEKYECGKKREGDRAEETFWADLQREAGLFVDHWQIMDSLAQTLFKRLLLSKQTEQALRRWT